MNFPPKILENNRDKQFSLSNKFNSLNPNAAEFVPSGLRSVSNGADVTRMHSKGTSGKAVLDRSESSVSNNSDDEAHQYWRHRLPDDITPDFKDMGEDELPGSLQLSLEGLSLHDNIGTSKFSAPISSKRASILHDRSPVSTQNFISNGNLEYSGSAYTGDQSSVTFMSAANSWGKQFADGHQKFTSGVEEHFYNENSGNGFGNNLLGDMAITLDDAVQHVEFLASQFPGFSAESLGDVYFANGCDLKLTIEMLAQFEQPQGDGGLNQNPEVFNASSLGTVISVADAQNGQSKYTRNLPQSPNIYRSTSSLFGGVSDFTSTINASQNNSHWKYERNGSRDVTAGPIKSSHLLTNPYNGHGKLVYGDKSKSLGAAPEPPVWLEAGEAMGNMDSELREEVHDFARLRNACLEQASQAYLMGNNVLARELSEKGHLYNMQLKAAQSKAGEAIYQQRNPISSEFQNYSRGGLDRLIDLHDLHVSEALLVLKHELNVLKSIARSSKRWLQAMICVGNGHHKAARTTARLPLAVEQFLLEESLHYTQPQPGLLHVLIH